MEFLQAYKSGQYVLIMSWTCEFALHSSLKDKGLLSQNRLNI